MSSDVLGEVPKSPPPKFTSFFVKDILRSDKESTEPVDKESTSSDQLNGRKSTTRKKIQSVQVETQRQILRKHKEPLIVDSKLLKSILSLYIHVHCIFKISKCMIHSETSGVILNSCVILIDAEISNIKI